MVRWRVGMVVATVAGFGCTEAPPVDGQAAIAAFPTIHRAVYDVYSVPLDRDAVWDQLAGSFEGPQLTREYIEHWTTRVAMRQEQTAIDVRQVDHEALSIVRVGGPGEPDLVTLDVDWSVGGIVTHQGHKHPRVNRYRARYDLCPTPEGWRIVATRMRDLSRVRSLLATTGGWPLGDDAPTSGGGFLDPLDLIQAGVLDGLSVEGDTALPTDAAALPTDDALPPGGDTADDDTAVDFLELDGWP